jgi:NAD(P)-dependent dehydrogenase (short-subunit alcohol dehydrogenase family)
MKQELDLTGKTIVITGATAGIGQAAAQTLAARGADMVGIGRSASRCQDAQQAILEAHPEANISFKVADLSSQRQVRRLAADLRDTCKEIDVLVNNAGTVSSWYIATEDGYELQFAVNHLAPFLLTYELLPLLEAAPAARVITVSSASHYRTRMHWADVMLFRNYNCLLAYKQSKLANVLFTAEFNRRLGQASNVRAYAVDPGLVQTNIGLKGTSGLEQWVWERRSTNGVSPEKGAETVIFLASAPALEDPGAIYWKDCQPKRPSRYALRQPEATRLWELSERLCGLDVGDGVEVTSMPNQTFTGSYA